MFGSGRTGTTSVAHKVFDSWSAPEPQHWSEGNHAHHVFDTIPDPRGRVLHVVVHQYQQLVSPELINQVFSAHGKVEEMFQTSHPNSTTHASSIFIKYAHGSMADNALHALHGLCLYRDDCQLEIRHANSHELQAFYGYSAPSLSEHQLDLLEQLQEDLQALRRDMNCRLVDVRMGTNLEPTPPTQNNLSATISPISAYESFCTEDKQVEQKCKDQEKQLKHAPVQLQLDLERLLLPAITIPAACAVMEKSNIDNLDQVLEWTTKQQQPQDSSSATIVALTVDSPILDEEYVESEAQVGNLTKIGVLHMSQPWPLPMEEVHNQNSSDAPMTTLTPTVVITVKGVAEESSNSQTAHINCRIIHPATPPNICRSIPFIPIRALWNFYFGLADSNLQPYALVKCIRQPWDPGRMHVLQSVDYQWSYSIINTMMSQHKLFAQNELLHRMRLCLSEDQAVIHVLQGTKNKWNHSVVAILTQKIQSSDKCQTPEIHENQKVQGFKLNEVRLTIITSQRCELIPQVGAEEQWRSVTWKPKIRAIFLLVATSGVPGIHHLLLWNLGLQKMQLQLHTIVGATRQMMFKTLLPGWQYFKTAALQVRGEVPTICLALNSCGFVLAWNTTLEASNFKINEAQLLAPTSAVHKLLYHVRDNTQLQSVTWKRGGLDIYLLVPTSTTRSVHLLLPWDPGAHQQLSAPKQVMVRKFFAAFVADQFDTHDIHQLNPKCVISWFMANKHEPSRFLATIFQNPQTNSVGFMLIYDCSAINSLLLTVNNHSFPSFRLIMMLDADSFMEWHSMDIASKKMLKLPMESDTTHHCSFFRTTPVRTYANLVVSPKKFQQHFHKTELRQSGERPMNLLGLPGDSANLWDWSFFRCSEFKGSGYYKNNFCYMSDLISERPEHRRLLNVILHWLVVLSQDVVNDPWDPGDNSKCNGFTAKRSTTTSEWMSVLKHANTVQNTPFLGTIITDLQVQRPSDIGALKLISLLTRAQSILLLTKAHYSAPLLSALENISPILSDLLLLAGTMKNGYAIIKQSVSYTKLLASQVLIFMKNSHSELLPLACSLKRKRHHYIQAWPAIVLKTLPTLQMELGIHGLQLSTMSYNGMEQNEVQLVFWAKGSTHIHGDYTIWDSGISLIYYKKLHILPEIQHATVPIQHQLHNKSITSLWEFSLEKDVQMQCDSGKSFQICNESQVVGRREMMPLNFLFHIGNITPTHYYEVCLVSNADHCQHAKGTHVTWDSGISFYRTLQPDSDTHHMAFTWNGNPSTHGLVGFYLKNFSHMPHLQTLGRVPKLWMISFMPP